MSRKDYMKLAAALADAKPHAGDHRRPAGSAVLAGALSQWEHDCTLIADVLSADNPRFDRTKFLTACGYFGEMES